MELNTYIAITGHKNICQEYRCIVHASKVNILADVLSSWTFKVCNSVQKRKELTLSLKMSTAQEYKKWLYQSEFTY